MPSLLLVLIVIAVALFVLAGVIWLFYDHGLDKLKNPNEWKDTGKAGEQIIFTTLRDKIHVPENQILRNV